MSRATTGNDDYYSVQLQSLTAILVLLVRIQLVRFSHVRVVVVVVVVAFAYTHTNTYTNTRPHTLRWTPALALYRSWTMCVRRNSSKLRCIHTCKWVSEWVMRWTSVCCRPHFPNNQKITTHSLACPLCYIFHSKFVLWFGCVWWPNITYHKNTAQN